MGLRIFIGSEKMTPEDASSHGAHHAFVFDGLGGAGGKLRTAVDGRQASEARIASNAAAAALDALVERRWVDWSGSLDFDSQAALEAQIRSIVVDEIGGAMSSALEAAAKEWNALDGKFPTTIAGWLTFPASEGKTLAVAVWAGDSRCYTIDADCMKLYSRDDAAEAYRRDAMEDCIYKDSLPMNNRLGRDQAFTLNYSCHIFQGPILLLSCSDGFYHCGESPMHFEAYFRALGAEESFEAMQTAWTKFILEDGRFEDDSATLETIFLHTDPDDVEALCTMLWARLDELEQSYIKPFPAEEGGKGYSDIDANVGQIVKRLCADEERFHFLEELRANAIRLAMEDSELPADMPCAQAVRQMRSDHLCRKREWTEKRAALEAEKAQAEKALDDRIQKAQTWDPKVNWEAAEPSPQVKKLLAKSSRWSPYTMDGNAQREIQNLMQQYGNAIRLHILSLALGYSYAHSLREQELSVYHPLNRPKVSDLPHSKAETFRNLQQYLVDQYALANKLAELNQVSAGSTKLQLGTATPGSQWFHLISSEEACLKEALIRAVDCKSPGDMEPLRNRPMKPLDMAAITMCAAEYVRVRRELEDFDQRREALTEPSAQPFDDYLRFHRSSDARYLIERWLETGKQPDCFRLSPELQKIFERNVSALQEKKEKNEAIQKENEERCSRRLALWEQYRPGFEAHDEPFTLRAHDDPPAPNAPEEPEFTPIQFQTVTVQDGAAVSGPDDDEDVETKNKIAAFMQENRAADTPGTEPPAPAEDAPGAGPAGNEGA